MAVTETKPVPAPTDCDPVLVNTVNALLVPNPNHAVVGAPFELTFPLSVADVEVTLVAALVDSVGRLARVVKFQLAENELQPTELPAFTRQ